MMYLGYRRAALLIWPLQDDTDSEIENVEHYAQTNLGTPSSAEPNPNEEEIFNRLIHWLEMHQGDRSVALVTRVLTRAAIHWKSIEMWTKACTTAKVDQDLRLLSPSIILEDIKVFRLDTLGALYAYLILSLMIINGLVVFKT
jgi:hypothetical protein